MTRWHRLSSREPTECEIHDSQGMLIVCSDHWDVCVMPVQMEPLYIPASETMQGAVLVRTEARTIMMPSFNMPMYARWSGEIVWWRMMPAAPGSWKKVLQWKWWQWKAEEMWKQVRR